MVHAPSASKAFEAEVPELKPTYEGLTGSDSPPATSASCTTEANASSPADELPMTCSGAADPKYEIGYTGGTLKVTKAGTALVASCQLSVLRTVSLLLGRSYTASFAGSTNFVLAQATGQARLL